MAVSCRSRPLRESGPGLAQLPGAGFLFHRVPPGVTGSCGPSAGVYALRPTGGEVKQVTGRVDVPVPGVPAVLAGIGAFLEGQLGFHSPACGARLGTWVEPAGQDDPAPVPCRLVGE